MLVAKKETLSFDIFDIYLRSSIYEDELHIILFELIDYTDMQQFDFERLYDEDYVSDYIKKLYEKFISEVWKEETVISKLDRPHIEFFNLIRKKVKEHKEIKCRDLIQLLRKEYKGNPISLYRGACAFFHLVNRGKIKDCVIKNRVLYYKGDK